MASLGSLLTLVVLAIDPFTQQVVEYTTRDVLIPYMNASLARRNNFNLSGNSFLNIGFAPIDLLLKAAIYDTLYNLSGDDVAIKLNCPTGNCTFSVENGSSFLTIGVCSRCAEITHDIQKVCSNNTVTVPQFTPGIHDASSRCSYTLPNSQWLIIPTDDAKSTVSYRIMDIMVANSSLESVNGSSTLQEIRTVFSNFSMLSYVGRNCTTGSTSNPQDQTCSFDWLSPLAVECALFFCVQSYIASVENNVLSEQVVSEFLKHSPFDIKGDPNAYVLAPQTCMVNGKSHDLASVFGEYSNNSAYLELYDLQNNMNTYVLHDCVYSVLSSAWESITSYFQHFFDGTVNGFVYSKSVDYSPHIMQTFFNNDNATLQTVTNTFAKLATSMTNSMRQNGYDVEKAQGLAFKNEVFIHVRWAWLSLPITLVLLSITFLAFTMKQSANVDIWKSSSLALLYHGLQDGQHDGVVALIQEMEELAKNHRVALGRTTSHGDLKLI